MKVFHHTFWAMNTRLSLVLPGIAEAFGHQLSAQIRAHVDADEEMMSRYRTGALATINARAFGDAVAVPDALWTILLLCHHHWQKTDGLFDIAQGARKDHRGAPGGLDKVLFDDAAQTVRFIAPVQLDLGGIGKGLALKGVETILRAAGVTQALVSFGESSILAIGEYPYGGPWRIGLAEAKGCEFSLRDEALSVSGQNTGEEHIIDPRRGGWATGPALMAVASPCPIEAEVLSTALLIADRPARDNILRRYRTVRLLDVPHFIKPIKEDQNVRRTSGP